MDDASSSPVIVLSGETKHLDRLKAESELPTCWFEDSLPAAHAGVRSHPSLARAFPDPSSGEPPQSLDAIDLTQKFILLAGRLVVEILVINSDTNPQHEAERFSTLVQGMEDYMLQRDTRVVFAVVIVDEGSGDAEPVLQRLNQLREAHSIDAVYVMTSLLEPRDRFVPAARDVWPVAVGRLLFHWMHCPPQASAGVPTFHAWRMMSLPPKSEQRLEESTDRLVQTLVNSIHDRVFRQPIGTKRPTPTKQVATSELLDSEIPALEPAPTYWTQFDVAQRFQQRLDQRRWHRTATKLAGQVVDQQHAAKQESLNRLVAYRREQWQAVHERPSTINQLALRKDVADNSSGDRGESERNATANMRAAQQHRDESIAEAARCATEFELAQQGQVGTVYRIWPCVAVAMAVGYPVIAVTYGIFGSITTPLLCGAVTILGCLIAAWYSAELENRAGIRARHELEEMLDAVDRSIEQFYIASALRFRGGSVLFDQYQAGLIDGHIRELAGRGQAVISLTHSKLRSLGSTSRQSGEASRGHADADHYCRELSLPLPFDMEVNVEQEVWWQQLVVDQAQRFQEQVWQTNLHRVDRYLTGNILGSELSPPWLAFHQSLAPLLVTQICRQQYNNASAGALTLWGAQLKRLQTLERETGLLSCHVPSSADNHHHDSPATVLVLQNGFEAIASTSTLPHTDLVHFDTPLDVLDQIPWLGYWFQHVPVAIAVQHGRLCVIDPDSAQQTNELHTEGDAS